MLQNLLHVHLSTFSHNIKQSSKFYWLGIINMLWWFGRNIAYNFLYGRKFLLGNESSQGKIWLLASSVNNYKTLRFLKEDLKNTYLVTTNTSAYDSDLSDINRLSFHYSSKYIFQFFRNFWTIFRAQGFFAFKIMGEIAEATGMYEACRRIIERGQPKAIIFANDHNIKNRALLLAANKVGIPTIYLQHASVTENFPPLEFSLSLLEGKDTQQKYEQLGPVNGTIKLVGMPRFDGYETARNQQKVVRHIGVCSNLEDKTSDLEAIIELLSNHFPDLVIAYRPHPRDTRTIALNKKVLISNSKEESIFDFLTQQDLIIASNTSTHLEATILNVVSIYYKFSAESLFNDAYGYVKNELVPAANNQEELVNLIATYQHKKPDVWQKAAFYNATLGTQYEGKSKALALKYIRELLEIDV